jgi:60 kDa SS-A/Ro ribonucleoprotein
MLSAIWAVGSPPARDRLIVITDEQSHDPVPQMKGYMINVASNKNGVGYGRWLHIDGWSDKVLDYIVKYESANEWAVPRHGSRSD